MSALDWDLYSQPGVWRTRIETNVATEDARSRFNAVWFASVEAVSPTTVMATDCAEQVSETVTKEEFIRDQGDWFGLGQPDDDEPALCPGDYQERYLVLTNDHFRIDATCDGEQLATVDLQRISSTPGFDSGTVSVAFDSYSETEVSDGVCGEFTSLRLDISSEGYANFDENVSVSVPYGDSFLFIDLSTSTREPSANEPLLAQGSTFMFDQGMADFSLTSQVFEADGSISDTLIPLTGSVTILQRDELSIQAQFEFTTSYGENVQGEFSLNID